VNTFIVMFEYQLMPKYLNVADLNKSCDVLKKIVKRSQNVSPFQTWNYNCLW